MTMYVATCYHIKTYGYSVTTDEMMKEVAEFCNLGLWNKLLCLVLSLLDSQLYYMIGPEMIYIYVVYVASHVYIYIYFIKFYIAIYICIHLSKCSCNIVARDFPDM